MEFRQQLVVQNCYVVWLSLFFVTVRLIDSSSPSFPFILGRIGLGFILPSLNIGAMRSLDRSHIPQGSSVINFLRMLGGAAGVSLCGIVLEWRVAAHGALLDTGTTSPARMAAFGETFLMLAAICAVAVVAALKLRER